MIEDDRTVIEAAILAHIPTDFKGTFPHVRTAGSDVLSVLVSFSIWLLHVLSGELFSPYGTCETYLEPLVMFSPLPTWLGIPYTFLKSATTEQSLIDTSTWEKRFSFYRMIFTAFASYSSFKKNKNFMPHAASRELQHVLFTYYSQTGAFPFPNLTQ